MAKTLNELLLEAEAARKELNEAILSDSFSQVGTAKEKLDKAVSDYNAQAVVSDYATLRSRSNPMMEAIKQLEISIVSVKPNKDKDSGIITYGLEPATKQIDLVAFDEFCQRQKLNIAPDKLWKYKVEHFALLVTYRVMREMGKDTKKLMETYYISEVAKQIDMGKTPTSNSQILKQLQTIIDAIIYEDDGGKNTYKATSHDVAYLLNVMNKRGKSGHIVTPRAATMHTLVMDILHRIITDGDYMVEYVTKKQAKQEAEEAAK